LLKASSGLGASGGFNESRQPLVAIN
jgi:hypothetical protein